MSIRANFTFPPGFMWGCATAAHQVEGDQANDWTQWEATAGHIFGNQPSGRACEWWRGRFLEDFDRAATMRNNAQRISIEWSRVEPSPGVFDEDALGRYREMLVALRERGMLPMVTLHHFTNPMWVAERGGWLSDETQGRLSDLRARWLKPSANTVRCGVPSTSRLCMPRKATSMVLAAR